ncbi:MAG: hypothetical protein AAFP76_07255 [Bacteroidota bacterium]
MKTLHVTDEQIQTYVFDLKHCDNPVIEHINSCTHCKGLVREYQYISNAVQALPQPGLDFNLAQSVLEKVPQPKQKHTPEYTRIGAWIILGLGVLAIGLNLVDSSPMGFMEREDFYVYFIGLVGLLIAVLWSLDLLKSFRKRMTAIN